MSQTVAPSAEHTVQLLKEQLRQARSTLRREKHKHASKVYYEQHRSTAKEKSRINYAAKARVTHTCGVCNKVMRLHNRALHDRTAKHRKNSAAATNGITDADE